MRIDREPDEPVVLCQQCGAVATCFGSYNQSEPFPEFACDGCCDHACENGRCWPVAQSASASAAPKTHTLM